MSNQVAKRGRGRPKGSRNKNKLLSGATVAQVCEYHKHHPTEFLVKVAKGLSVDGFEPTHDDVYRANIKLHDSIHHNKTIGGAGEEAIDGQYEIVFVEASEGFQLPGEANAESHSGALQSEQIQRTGDS